MQARSLGRALDGRRGHKMERHKSSESLALEFRRRGTHSVANCRLAIHPTVADNAIPHASKIPRSTHGISCLLPRFVMHYKDSQTKKSARTERSKQIATPPADLLSDLVQETGRVFDLTDRNKFQRECDSKIVAQHFKRDVGII